MGEVKIKEDARQAVISFILGITGRLSLPGQVGKYLVIYEEIEQNRI